MTQSLSDLHHWSFYYDGEFFADPDGLGRGHRRAQRAHFDAALKLSELNPTEDKSVYWYRGQLAHYGLQDTENIDLAKHHLRMLLLQHARHDEPRVPPEIQEVETRLRAQ